MTTQLKDWYCRYGDPHPQTGSLRAPPNLQSYSESPMNQSIDGSRQPLEHLPVPLEFPQGQKSCTRPQLPGIDHIVGISRTSPNHSYGQETFCTEFFGKSSSRLPLGPIAEVPRSKPQKQTRSAKEDRTTLHLSSPLRPKEVLLCSLFPNEQTQNDLEQWTDKYSYVLRSPSSSFAIDGMKLADVPRTRQLPVAGHVEEIALDNERAYEKPWHDSSIYEQQIHEQEGSNMEIIVSVESLSEGLDDLGRFAPGSKRRRRHTGEACVDCGAENSEAGNADYDCPWCRSKRRYREQISTPTSVMIGAQSSAFRKDTTHKSNVHVDFRSTCKRIGDVLEMLDTEITGASVKLWRELVTQCKTSTDSPTCYYAKPEWALLSTEDTRYLLPERNILVARGLGKSKSADSELGSTSIRDAIANMLQYSAHMMSARVVRHQFLPPARIESCISTAHSHALQLLRAFRDVHRVVGDIDGLCPLYSISISPLILDLATLAFDTIGAGGLVLEIAAVSQAMEEVLGVLTSIPSIYNNQHDRVKVLQERFALVRSAVPNKGDLIPYKACWKTREPVGANPDFQQDVMYGVSYATFFSALIKSRIPYSSTYTSS